MRHTYTHIHYFWGDNLKREKMKKMLEEICIHIATQYRVKPGEYVTRKMVTHAIIVEHLQNHPKTIERRIEMLQALEYFGRQVNKDAWVFNYCIPKKLESFLMPQVDGEDVRV